MSEVTYRQAINRALADELAADPDVFLLGEDIGAGGGVFKVTQGLFETFGPRRVRDTPISEQAIIGCALGAALRGLRPVAEIMFADFAAVCFDQIVNQVAKYRYLSNGQVGLPLTIRLATGAGAGFAAQHSQSAENWFLNVPGLRSVVPSTPSDAYWLLRAAIRDPNPVLYFEHKNLYAIKGIIETCESVPALGHASIVRTGRDVTIVTCQMMLALALQASDRLQERGICAEIIDLRSLMPLDTGLIGSSVGKTGRLLCVQEAPRGGSWADTLVSLLATDPALTWRAAPAILGGAPTPVPYAAQLEAAYLPSRDALEQAVIQLFDARGGAASGISPRAASAGCAT